MKDDFFQFGSLNDEVFQFDSKILYLSQLHPSIYQRITFCNKKIEI